MTIPSPGKSVTALLFAGGLMSAILLANLTRDAGSFADPAAAAGREIREEPGPGGGGAGESGGNRVVINEIAASNRHGLIDEDGKSSDWIEIYNGSANAVDLGGWAISDNPDQPAKWKLPRVSLPARE